MKLLGDRIGMLGGHLEHGGQVVALLHQVGGDVVGMLGGVLQHDLQVALFLLEFGDAALQRGQGVVPGGFRSG